MHEDTQVFVFPVQFYQLRIGIICQLWNPTDEPIALRSGTLIGQLNVLSQYGIIQTIKHRSFIHGIRVLRKTVGKMLKIIIME